MTPDDMIFLTVMMIVCTVFILLSIESNANKIIKAIKKDKRERKRLAKIKE